MYYLYQKPWHEAVGGDEYSDFLKQCSIERFAPRLFRLGPKDEAADLKTRLGRLHFWLITKGKFAIYFLRKDDRIVHTAYLVPKCGKFPFLSDRDYEIGPCVTQEAFRRKGCYRFVLEQITSDARNRGAGFYMIVRDSNLASIAGIEKAGFHRSGSVRKDRWLNYKMVENE